MTVHTACSMWRACSVWMAVCPKPAMKMPIVRTDSTPDTYTLSHIWYVSCIIYGIYDTYIYGLSVLVIGISIIWCVSYMGYMIYIIYEGRLRISIAHRCFAQPFQKSVCSVCCLSFELCLSVEDTNSVQSTDVWEFLPWRPPPLPEILKRQRPSTLTTQMRYREYFWECVPATK